MSVFDAIAFAWAFITHYLSYQQWLEIGLGISLFFNLVFGICTIGIVFVDRAISPNRYNRELVVIIIGGLFSLLGGCVVAVMTGDGPFKQPLLAVVVLGSFLGILLYMIAKVRR
jgi:hypothetical protein